MAASVSDLLTALKTAWDAESSLSSFGGPYRDREPADASPSFPYVIIQTLPSTLEAYTSRKESWQDRLEFRIFNSNPEAASANAKVVAAVFDSLLPTLASGQGRTFRVRREGESSEEEDKGVWRHVLTYSYLRAVDRAS